MKADQESSIKQSTEIESIMPKACVVTPVVTSSQPSKCTCFDSLRRSSIVTAASQETQNSHEKQLQRIMNKEATKAILERAYLQDPNWTIGKMVEIARQLGCGYKKIYKWHWDRKKRDRQYMANN